MSAKPFLFLIALSLTASAGAIGETAINQPAAAPPPATEQALSPLTSNKVLDSFAIPAAVTPDKTPETQKTAIAAGPAPEEKPDLAATSPSSLPQPETAAVVSAAVLVGFIARCHRKGFPFLKSKVQGQQSGRD